MTIARLFKSRFSTACLCVLFLCVRLSAQELPQHVEAGFYLGKMLPIYPGFPITAQHTAFQFSWSQRHASQANENFGRPFSGVALSLHDFGNTATLGYGIGLQYQMTFSHRVGKRLSVVAKFRPGAVFSTKPFDYLDNTGNIVTGSHVAALMGIAAGAGYDISPRTALLLEASVWHASNGHSALPNVGMNSPMLSLSVRHAFGVVDTSSRPPTGRLASRVGFVAFAAVGVNEAGGTVRPVNGSRYLKALGAMGVMWRTRSVHRWTLTLEPYYDRTYRLWNETQEWATTGVFLRSSALMLMLGHEWIYQRWGLVINGGVNLYNPTLGNIIEKAEAKRATNTIKRYVPGRFAVRYYLSHPWRSESSAFVQAGIKSNFGQADFFEVALGCVIAKRQAKP